MKKGLAKIVFGVLICAVSLILYFFGGLDTNTMLLVLVIGLGLIAFGLDS